MAAVPELGTGIPASSDAALRLAYAQNPALAAAQENIVASQFDAKVRKASFRPRVDLRAQQEVGKNLGGYIGRTTRSNIGLVLNYNLYNGGSDQATQRQYAEQINVAKDMRDKECRDVRQTLYIAYNDIGRLKEQLGYLERHMNSQQKALKAYYSQFDIGQRTLLDLLDSENEVFQAQRAYQNAYFDYLLAMGRTHAAMGDLVKTLSVDHLTTDEVAAASDFADFDPNTVCPIDDPAQVKDDKDALYAASQAALPKDSDRDGVTDDKDACPGTPTGTRVDAKGCPLQAVTTLKGVNFEYASAKLRPESLPVLDEAAQTLKQNADLKVEVAGHTDNNNHSLDPDLNVKLSQRRAEAVMDYLVAHGVPASQLTAKGYGAARPVADNATAEGQAENRRVELRIVQ
jgi:adhesin transport system outer membrane protein